MPVQRRGPKKHGTVDAKMHKGARRYGSAGRPAPFPPRLSQSMASQFVLLPEPPEMTAHNRHLVIA